MGAGRPPGLYQGTASAVPQSNCSVTALAAVWKRRVDSNHPITKSPNVSRHPIASLDCRAFEFPPYENRVGWGTHMGVVQGKVGAPG
jgi:hypothetical protein